MITISLCMIVKDEEESLDKCLKSVSSIVDEIIIVITSILNIIKFNYFINYSNHFFFA